MHLVALHGVIKEIGRVGIKVEVVINQIDINVVFIAVAPAPGVARQTVTITVAAIGRIHAAVQIKRTAFDSPRRNLVGRVPSGVIGLGVDRQTPVFVVQRIAQHAVVLAQVFRLLPYAVISVEFAGIKQIARADFFGIG